LVKEQLLRFDETPLFPERYANTVSYTPSPGELALYAQVTDYVREEMNRADRLAREGESRRGTVVGFALTILQRRLASSPEAIYQSLRRRRERLERRLREEQIHRRGQEVFRDLPAAGIDTEDLLEIDEEAPSAEREQLEQEILDQATAARTIAELELEIAALKRLEQLADGVRRSGTDRKWEELSALLQRREDMFDAGGARRKLIIFTEHRDTLHYLAERITTLLGSPGSV